LNDELIADDEGRDKSELDEEFEVMCEVELIGEDMEEETERTSSDE
jgi:hypothetical protein